MVIVLPFPVSVNSLYGGGSNQRRFPSKKYKTWLLSCPKLSPLKLTDVSLHYKFYFPDNRARDAANLEKCVTDYLVKQNVIIDDSWQHIKYMGLSPMGIDRERPRVEVYIT